MSASKFISELERRKFLSDRLMKKLRESLAATRSPLSAEKLANFLVQKKHLTQNQANDVLAGLTQSGVNLIEEDLDDEDAAGSSSIFPPQITGGRKKEDESPTDDGEDDEIRLVPIDDDVAVTKASRVPVDDDGDLPVLGTIPSAEKMQRTRTNAAPVVKLAELGDAGEVNETGSSRSAEDQSESEQLSETVGRARRTTSLSRDKKSGKKKAKSNRDKKRWDSPLILLGGGGLVFLLLAGGTIWFLLTFESGDQKVALAREAMKSGAYPQAIEQFQDFLTTSPRHPEHSLARVQLAMLKIRQPTEAGDFEHALEAVEKETKAVEDEPAFNDSHEDLAALIPQIADGLAKQAEKAPPTSDDSKKYVSLANKALELCNNSSYVPKTVARRGEAHRRARCVGTSRATATIATRPGRGPQGDGPGGGRWQTDRGLRRPFEADERAPRASR